MEKVGKAARSFKEKMKMHAGADALSSHANALRTFDNPTTATIVPVIRRYDAKRYASALEQVGSAPLGDWLTGPAP